MGSYWNLERFTFKSKDSVYKLVFEVESGKFKIELLHCYKILNSFDILKNYQYEMLLTIKNFVLLYQLKF